MRVNIIILAAMTTGSFAHAQLGMVPQLQNSPFSAEIVSTQVQTLADGTHITQPERTTKVYRDSFGRTRSETSMLPNGARLQGLPATVDVLIVDPVDGAEYFLNPNKKTAQRTVMPKRSTQAAPSELPVQAQARLGVAQAGAIYPAIIGNPPNGSAARPNSKTESLGTQTMEGFIVEGRRTTMTWAVGTMGNDREIVTANETWRSAELGMMVLSKNSDPRSGDRTTTMTNVSRAEPDPALFQVPSDYTIMDAPKPPALPASPPGTAR